MTAKEIVDRHLQYPKSTEKLIEAYAFQQYKKAINDLLRFGKSVKVENTNTVIVVISDVDFEYWKDLKMSNWYLNNCINLP